MSNEQQVAVAAAVPSSAGPSVTAAIDSRPGMWPSTAKDNNALLLLPQKFPLPKQKQHRLYCNMYFSTEWMGQADPL